MLCILKKVNGLKANLTFNFPKLFIHGRHDTIAPYLEFEDLYKEAKGKKEKFILNTDHFYMGNYPTIITKAAKKIRNFFQREFSS